VPGSPRSATKAASAKSPTSAIGRRRVAAAHRGGTPGYADRRSAIMSIAADLFKEHGYNRTTLADIAVAVGTDRASLYYYFGSKEELLDALVTHLVIENTEAAERTRDSEGPAPEKLRALIVDLMVSFAANYPMLYVYLQGNLSHISGKRAAWAQQMREINHRWENAIQAIVQQGIDEGTIRPLADPRILANGVIGVVGWTSRWYNPARDLDAVVIGEAYAEMILGGVEIPLKKKSRPRS
jgi:AcrR family transcriptional regulator